MPTHRPARPGSGRPERERPRQGRASHETLYGRNAVREALRGLRVIHRLLVSRGARIDERLDEIIKLAGLRGAPVAFVDREELEERASGVNHQGVVAETGPYVFSDVTQIAARDGVVVALDHLQDPQNIGTLLRSAVAFSAAGVLIPSDRAADITPAVVNASSGATELVAIAQVTNLARELDRLKDAGRWVIGLDTGEESVSIAETKLPTPTVLVIGAEGAGIGRLVRERCDMIVAIPISAAIDSLNAATAASIALFELERQLIASR